MTATSQKVVIVNGNADVLALVDTVLDAGHYDVVLVESSFHAYSQVKRAQPNLVILCLRIDSLDAFQVLSMLKLDPDTRDIPVVTYTTGCDGSDAEEEEMELSEPEMFTAKAAVSMN